MNKKYIWISHESYGKPLIEIIQKILLKNNVHQNNFNGFPISIETQSLKDLTDHLINFSEIKDFN